MLKDILLYYFFSIFYTISHFIFYNNEVRRYYRISNVQRCRWFFQYIVRKGFCGLGTGTKLLKVSTGNISNMNITIPKNMMKGINTNIHETVE